MRRYRIEADATGHGTLIDMADGKEIEDIVQLSLYITPNKPSLLVIAVLAEIEGDIEIDEAQARTLRARGPRK